MTPHTEPYAEGQVLPERSYTVTRDDLRRYAAASGDDNPVHLRDAVAITAGFPGVIAHGMYTLALAGRALEEWAGGRGRVQDVRAKFTRPVVVPRDDGAVVTVGGVVRSVERTGDQWLVTVALEVTCGIDRVLGAPRATFSVPDGGEG
jgi:acyl dehydratase